MTQPLVPDGLRRVRLLALGVIGAILLGGALTYWQVSSTLDESGRPAAAEVVSVDETGSLDVRAATVRFTIPNGPTITTTTRPGELADPPPAVGSTITVIYDPEEPQARVRDPLAPHDGIARSVGAAAVGFAGLGLLLVTITRLRAGTRKPTG
jgi:hypothetical protein